MTSCILLDIDGTIADLSHRSHHVKNGNKNWKAFFAEAEQDKPIQEVIDVAQALYYDNHYIIVVSGRTEEIRDVTERWLRKHNVCYNELYMRPAGDYRPDHEVKKDILDKLRSEGLVPWLAIDDRPSILTLWESEGIKTLACKSDESTMLKEPKNTPILQIMVGPSGAGKSTWVANQGGRPWDEVVSTDCLRKQLTGDFQDQSRNDEVFAAYHAIIGARLWSGLTTIADATHIRTKDRKEVVSLAPPNAMIQYIVIDRPLEEKRATGGWRNELDFDLIGKHDNTFKSNLKDILSGDGNPRILINDQRTYR